MKKLFTLIALLACFMGAKAEWVTDYEKSFSEYADFPFYVMGYAPSIIDGTMVDNPVPYRKLWRGNESDYPGDDGMEDVTVNGGAFKQQSLDSNPWRQYFIADGIPTEIDGSYKVTAMVKASEAVSIDVSMGWGWGSGESVNAKISIGTEWAEVEWEYSGIAGTSCNLVAKPGTTEAVIEWKSIKVTHNAKPQRPTVWQEWLTSDGQPVIVETTSDKIATYMGNAETPWADPNVKFNDQEKNYLICAWGKEKGVNLNENDGWDPFPATIELDETDPNGTNHVFVVHGKLADTPKSGDQDPSAWDNQFWIQSPKNWKEGESLKIHFRYRANRDGVKTNTQVHKQNPSDYKHWAAIGDITFNEAWQEFDKIISWPNGAGDEGWSIAFNLNPEVKDPVDFFFDDLSWCSMKLDEGYFVAGSNPDEGLEYDFDNAIQFEEDTETGFLVATVGEKNAYVNQIMISTVRGNDAAFKANTLKPKGTIVSDPDEWLDYAPASLAKLTLPGTGIWKITIAPEYGSMSFEMTEGTMKEPIDVVTNTTGIVVKGVAREDLQDNKNDAGEITVREEADDPNGVEVGGAGHTGQTWDNQFWFKANRTLAKGEVTHLKFKYKASTAAKTTTQCHGNPGGYMHWAAIGDVTFATEWADFDQDFTVPNEADGMQTIAFNMAEIKEACDYEIKDVQWYLKDESLDEGKTWENLINETGTDNFFVKIGAGTDPKQYEDSSTGISTIATEKNAASANIYNIAGQRVSDSYKGIVIKNGKKVVIR